MEQHYILRMFPWDVVKQNKVNQKYSIISSELAALI